MATRLKPSAYRAMLNSATLFETLPMCWTSQGDREDAAAELDREDGWPSFLVIYCIYHLRLKPLPGLYITSPPPGRIGWSQILREV